MTHHPARHDEIVRLQGHRIRMRITGAGPPLLLLNGLTRPLESWAPVIQELPGRTVVTFDAPGVGGSPTPVLPLSISTLARLATAVLAEAGLDSADVLGYSHGGAVAQQLALDAPARVRRLILVSTSCGIGAIPGDYSALTHIGAPPDSPRWPGPDAIGTLWQFLAIASWSSIPFLGAIRTPTLVVSGTRDGVVPAGNSRLLARRIPGAQLVLLPTGHDVQRPGPARLLAYAIEPFLAVAGSDQNREVS